MGVNIRQPHPDDLQDIVDYMRAVYAESPRYQSKTFMEEKAYNLASYFIAKPNSGGFIAEKNGRVIGMIGGGISEFLLSNDKYVSDLLVYVDPAERGGTAFLRLVRAFEGWAKEQGAAEMILGISTEINRDETVCVYERIGYKLCGISMNKIL